ncbi:RHS repeat domain-containing protein, partial [Snodgrassella alvi]
EGCRNQRYWETLQYDAAANLLDSKYREDYSNYNLIRCNQLLHFRSHHYRYDEHGRTQIKQSIGATQHYHYDAEHRLSEVRIEQTGRSQRYGYVYDALGRRIEKHQIDRDGQPYNRTRFLWDGLRMIQETGPNHPTSLYIYTDQNSYEPLARIDTDGNHEQHIRYFHTDLNGCPEELTDANGKILWECSFQLWGKRIHEIEHEPIEQNLRYQGQYLDRETGLHYNTFRYYDPDIGRFTQPDPIGLLGGFNLYQYAPNGLTWIDPRGLHGEWVNPNDINFSQRTISANNYAEIMKNGQWDWNRSPLNVIEVDGQLVTYDNRRLDAALEAGSDKVKVIKVDPNAPHPNSNTGKTWWQKFQQRFNDKRNKRAGGVVPNKGLSQRPIKC